MKGRKTRREKEKTDLRKQSISTASPIITYQPSAPAIQISAERVTPPTLIGLYDTSHVLPDLIKTVLITIGIFTGEFILFLLLKTNKIFLPFISYR